MSLRAPASGSSTIVDRAVWIAGALALWAALSSADAGAESLQFERLFTIGSKAGVNPRQKLVGPLARLSLGAPERLSPIVAPAAVTVDAEDRIWIADTGSASVHMFDLLQNKYKRLRGDAKATLQCPSAIDSDAHGRIYVADPCLGKILIFDRDGEFVRSLLGPGAGKILQAPAALTVSQDLKSIYVADPRRHKVVVLNQEGETIREWGETKGPAELLSPTALATDVERHRILVLDSTRRRVQMFSPGGAHLGSLAWPRVREPSAFAFDSNRRLFFVGDPRFEAVHVFDEQGAPVSEFGQAGTAVDAFHTPRSLYVDFRGRVYVVDPVNAAVLVFREVQGRSPATNGDP